MAASGKPIADKDREEDFRDYDQRNIGDGWPYADGEKKAKRNPPYGEAPDELDPTSMEVAADTFIESDGGPSLFPEEEEGNVTDDVIEDAIATKISDADRWDDNQITITVHNRVVDLEGEVETEQERQLINQLALRTAGVKFVRNNLILIGVDSHIPPDADE